MLSIAAFPLEQAFGLAALGLAGFFLVVAIAIVIHRPVLARWHEFHAWRRKQRFDSWKSVGDQLLEVRDYQRASYWYRRLVDEYPSSTEAWYGLASCLEDAQDFEEASRAYERAHEVTSGGDGGFLASAAKCACQAGERERAIELFVALAEDDRKFAEKMLGQETFSEIRTDARLKRFTKEESQEDRVPYA